MANGIFNPGSGTLKSTTLVNAFLELAMLTQTSERVALGNQATIVSNNLTVPDLVNISANFNTDTMTVNIPALPIAVNLNAGNLEIEAVDYLEPLNAVVPSVDNSLNVTGSDLSKTNRVQALLELAQLIQIDERAKGVNNLTLSINTDTSIASISGVFRGTPQVNNDGYIQFVATNYLA